MQSQDLANGWEEVKQMKVEIQTYFQEADQQLQNMKRRRAELEIKLAQNMVSQLKVLAFLVIYMTKIMFYHRISFRVMYYSQDWSGKNLQTSHFTR